MSKRGVKRLLLLSSFSFPQTQKPLSRTPGLYKPQPESHDQQKPPCERLWLDQAQIPAFAELDWATIALRALVNILFTQPLLPRLFPNTTFFIKALSTLIICLVHFSLNSSCVELLLCARHCFMFWGSSRRQNVWKALLSRSLYSSGERNKQQMNNLLAVWRKIQGQECQGWGKTAIWNRCSLVGG